MKRLDDYSERMIAEGCLHCEDSGIVEEVHDTYAVEAMGCPACYGAAPLAAEVKRLRGIVERVALLEKDNCNGSFVGAIVAGWLNRALYGSDEEWATFAASLLSKHQAQPAKRSA